MSSMPRLRGVTNGGGLGENELRPLDVSKRDASTGEGVKDTDRTDALDEDVGVIARLTRGFLAGDGPAFETRSFRMALSRLASMRKGTYRLKGSKSTDMFNAVFCIIGLSRVRARK